MEIRISQFYFDLFIKILNSCQFSLFGSEFLTVFWSSLLGSEVSKKNHFSFGVPRGNQKFYGLWISKWFFSFFSILYGDQNFPILFWSFYKDSEFLSVFFMGIRISECFLDFFMGIRISECFLDFFMGIRISKCFFRLLYGDQNFWMFYGLLYGDGNFWTFSFQIFMEIRNSEFSPESFSVLDKRLKNSLQSWNSNFAIHPEEIWDFEQRNKLFLYILH